MKSLLIILIATISIAAVNDLKLKIYYVITYRSNERVIEKVYLKKETHKSISILSKIITITN